MQNKACRKRASHTRSVASFDPLTKRFDGNAQCAGSHASDVTHLVCPLVQGREASAL